MAAISDIMVGSEDDELGKTQERADAGCLSKVDVAFGEGFTIFSTEEPEVIAERYRKIVAENY